MTAKPLTPSRTREILRGLEHFPKKRLGQNFLIDGNIVRKSCQLADLQPSETVIEIGSGLGTLTQTLLKAGAEVFAIETDPTLASYLMRELGPAFPDNLHLIQADAVENPLAGFDPTMIGKGKGRKKDFKIVSNLPYAISSPWLKRVLEGPLPFSMTLMLQQETADRYTAEPGSKSFGAITVFLRSAFDLAGKHKVSRQCFYPVPAVDSVLLKLVRKKEPFKFSEKTVAKIRALFTQRRKQIGALCGRDPELTRWAEYLKETGIPLESRPNNLPLAAWQMLNNLYYAD